MRRVFYCTLTDLRPSYRDVARAEDATASLGDASLIGAGTACSPAAEIEPKTRRDLLHEGAARDHRQKI